MMAGLVTIFGGSGFVGRYIARRLAADGWRVRVAVRRPNEAGFVRPYGVVGQVEPIFANIRDDASVAAAIAGADAVVNCVGVFDTTGKNNGEAVNAEGAGRVARLAAEAGVSALVHVSALGVAEGASDYARSKAAGEAAVLEHFPSAMILRPSVMFGPEDGFFNRFAWLARWGMFLPVVGGRTRFQPVYVDDVAAAAVLGAEGKARGVYELGGPDVADLATWVRRMLKVVLRRRVVVNLPFWIASIMAFCFDAVQTVTLGLIHNALLTRDQLRQLRHDSVVSEGARGLEALGISPTPAETVMPEYLWKFRPSGQYDAIKASARNLKV
jgi:NADH dehydrogenase